MINKNKIDITKLMLSKNFVLSNYLNERQAFEFIILGIPCGAIQAFYNNKELTHRQEHNLSDKQLEKVRQVYVPINSIEELKKHHATHFCSYTINPKYIAPQKVQSFVYRFDLLTKEEMGMFDINQVNKHQIEMLGNKPLTYKKLEDMKNKYITTEKEKKCIENNKKYGLTEERFYELLNEDGCKEVGNYFLDEYNKREKGLENSR